MTIKERISEKLSEPETKELFEMIYSAFSNEGTGGIPKILKNKEKEIKEKFRQIKEKIEKEIGGAK